MIQYFFSIFIYIFFIIVIFWQPLAHKLGSIQWDAVSVHFFNLFFSFETLHNGILPLWSPYIFAGFPQIADLQVAFFYPINLFIGLFAVFTPELLTYQIVIHYFLAGFFTFLFARRLSNNFFFSLAAGVVYAFGGFMLGHASHVGMQNTAAWLPLILYLLIITLKNKKIFYASLCGLSLGFAILAGHFQISLYIAYAMIFYFLYDIAFCAASFFTKNSLNIGKIIINKIWLVSIVFIVAFLISAVQLLPTYELTQQSNRAKISLEMSQTESLNPDSLKALIYPNYNNVGSGDPYLGPWDRTQNYLYLGYTIIIFAVLGLLTGLYIRESRKMTLFWLFLLIISLFYSFGEFGFLQKYFYKFVPFFDKTRAPANMMLMFNMSIIALASILFKNMNKKLNNIAFFIEARNSKLLINNLSQYKQFFLKNTPNLVGLLAFIIISSEIIPAALAAKSLLYSPQESNSVISVTPIIKTIQDEYNKLDEINKFRTFRVPELDRNFSQVLRIYAFDGYNPLSLKRYNNYVDAMVKNNNLIDLAAIKYLPCEYITETSYKIKKIDKLCINNNYLPLAFFIDNFIVAENETSSLNMIQNVDLNNTIILEEQPAENIAAIDRNYATRKNNNVKIIDSNPGFLKITTESEENKFLFISQSNYPGWTAKIDNDPIKIYQADYLFQAIYIPAGIHTVYLQFESKPLIIGKILTIIGLSFVSLIFLSNFIRIKQLF